VVEDRLRAIAVMVVDVEHGDPLSAGVTHPLRGDRGVVEETVAAVIVCSSMMARRPAQSEGSTLAAAHPLRRCERAIGGGPRRGIGVLADGCAGIERITSEQSIYMDG